MPVLRDNEDIQKFYLPSTKDAPNEEDRAWITLDVSPQKGRDLLSVQSGDTSGLTYLKKIAARLREWNYFDESGAILPINVDTVQIIEDTDLDFINNLIVGKTTTQPLSDTEKKA